MIRKSQAVSLLRELTAKRRPKHAVATTARLLATVARRCGPPAARVGDRPRSTCAIFRIRRLTGGFSVNRPCRRRD